MVYFIAKIDYETEDRPSAVKGFKASLAILESHKFDPRATCCFMKGCNDIAVVHSEREEHDNAFAHLSNAKKIYEEVIEKNCGNVWDQWEVLKSEPERLSKAARKENFEDVFTHTLFFLAQTTKNLGDSDCSASYCGMCLERQLKSTKFEPREWALHAACLRNTVNHHGSTSQLTTLLLKIISYF